MEFTSNRKGGLALCARGQFLEDFKGLERGFRDGNGTALLPHPHRPAGL